MMEKASTKNDLFRIFVFFQDVSSLVPQEKESEHQQNDQLFEDLSSHKFTSNVPKMDQSSEAKPLTISALKLFSGDILYIPYTKTSLDFSMSKIVETHHSLERSEAEMSANLESLQKEPVPPGFFFGKKPPRGGWGFVLGVAGFLWVVVACFFFFRNDFMFFQHVIFVCITVKSDPK